MTQTSLAEAPIVGLRRVSRGLVAGAFAAVSLLTPRASAQPTLISRAPDGTPGNLSSDAASLSRDGRFVAFVSSATNLVAGDTNGFADVFVHDRTSGTTDRVSVASDGTQANHDSRAPSISGDGRYVAFESDATNLDPGQYAMNSPAAGDHNGTSDVFVHDRVARTTSRISVGRGRLCAPTCLAFVVEGNGPSRWPAISEDGRFVTFTSGASNLVAGDTNGSCSVPEWYEGGRTWCADVFVSDLQGAAIERVSVDDAGVEGNGWSGYPAISGDGHLVVFDSTSTNLTADVRTPCEYHVSRRGVFLRDRTSARTTRLDADEERRCEDGTVTLNPSGTLAGFVAQFSYGSDIVVIELATGTRHRRWFEAFKPESWWLGASSPVLSDSRLVSHSVRTRCYTGTRCGAGQLWDLNAQWTMGAGIGARLSGDGRVQSHVEVTPDENGWYLGPSQVYAEPIDADGDTLPDAWERRFGFDPADPADAGLDPDDDGVTTREEWLAGTHPQGTWRAYFAEGAAGFFATDVAKVNAGPEVAVTQLRVQGPAGPVRQVVEDLRASEVSTTDVTALPGVDGDSFWMVVESDRPLAAVREMSWEPPTATRPPYAAHASAGVPAPATTWYLAEGATHSGFDLFYLLVNPGDEPAQVEIAYLRPAPAAPLSRRYPVPPRGRLTIWVDFEDSALANTDVSATIESDRPIVVERSMYLTTGTRVFEAGHAAAAIPTPSTLWYFAEGTTQPPFDTFIAVLNPNAAIADVRVTYLLPDGTTRAGRHTVPGMGRTTIWTNREPANATPGTRLLPSTAFSAIVESINAVPIVVERASWWGSPVWYGGHATAGIPEAGTEWLVVGRGGWWSAVPNGDDTYLLIANVSDRPGRIRLQSVHQSLGASDTLMLDLAPTSRLSVSLRMLYPWLGSFAYSRTGFRVTSLPPDGAPPDTPPPDIVVEHASYWDNADMSWSAGTCASATRVR